MDMYWSVERCGWEPCPQEASAVTPWTGWLVAEPDAAPELPQQRTGETAVVDA
jgi:hypothetical protein